MVDQMSKRSKSALAPATMKMFMYSAHDVTVAAFLSALGVFNNIQPPYASLVLVELHQTGDKQFAVQVNCISR